MYQSYLNKKLFFLLLFLSGRKILLTKRGCFSLLNNNNGRKLGLTHPHPLVPLRCSFMCVIINASQGSCTFLFLHLQITNKQIFFPIQKLVN